MRFLSWLRRCFGIALGIIFVVTVWANVIVLKHKDRIVHDTSYLATTTTALVFGGGMYPDGTMSDMQTDRVKKAVELYKAEKVQKLIMTGDDGARRFNEVDAMTRFAIDNGVKETDILVDPHGYNTYSSCYRALEQFRLDSTVVVSQDFHLPRIIYLCEHFGVETVGVSADIRPYGFFGSLWSMHIREILARVKGWWQVEVTRPGPLQF